MEIKKYKIPSIKDVQPKIDVEALQEGLRSDAANAEAKRISSRPSFSIDKLMANLSTPAMTNQFRVNFFGPSIVITGQSTADPARKYNFENSTKGYTQNTTTTMKRSSVLSLSLEGVRCRNASLPSRTIETEGYSPVGKTKIVPTGVVNDMHEMEISFYCDTNFIDRKILQAWMDFIVTTDTSEGGVSHERNKLPLFEYPNRYQGTVEIEHLRRDGRMGEGTTTVKNTLHGAFPKAIATQTLSMDSADMLLFSVTMAFQHFTTEYKDAKLVADLSDLHSVYNGSNKVNPSGLNSGRRRFDGILEGLGLAAQFGDDRAEKYLKRFNKYDSQVSRLKDSLRDFSSLFGG
tara:strand:+ start:4880 stop:5920 length:1041 start_codon:yes stop_codon:yes gene_type:complete